MTDSSLIKDVEMERSGTAAKINFNPCGMHLPAEQIIHLIMEVPNEVCYTFLHIHPAEEWIWER